ncbi:DUF58 domain-containing protein [Gammaproteobacteria bacterium]|mgnify:FL=1|jgi:uncharacterized protein (DUF58 family)|uniref:DUF58 domain-containing protein n=3 Tax=OM182 clade TaxID=745002 RepID=A0A0R2T4D5_9GAMM|nr:MAG: hypothetical protein ABR85_07525 [OM182 bacterium BACL3 MAG-120619-bin3]KRP27622.1 MAG: hypothetical protein ABS30_07720 [OM182 bacterium BACL3 MAG-120924-bin41]KRP35087.1 MAG: hypothetical protein ABS27_02175 [OM182 bacterium BACL3 MAG-121001-bin29]KRP38948.1 MAG: hypothetical protein ABS26_01890 [OM182 bacterium BACL3 MAG-120531-bin86]MBT3521470.1 DUF58 domain-containing protein [Gammaproteobacteria bacterium]MDP4660155.1 DUF58 domain-containing protein [OM182 bacterium]
MVAKSKLDPQHERYRSRGALITLPQMLIQRQAAKALAYVSHARSIAGISGLHLSKIRGRGIDFEEFRPYQAGDDIRLIDWRATARTGRAVTKVFREERERPVIIAVDQCSSMFFGSQVAFKSVIAAQAAALFCWLAIDNGDRVGGLVFSDTDASLVRPKRSRRSALHLLNQIFTFNQKLNAKKEHTPDSEPQAADFKPGLAHALGQIRRITKPGSTLYVISDFATLDETALQYLNQLSRHNNVVCCMVYDALEESLPTPGVYSITDGSSKGSINTHSSKARSRYKQQFEERVATIESDLERLKIRLIKLRTNQLVVEQVREWIAKNS